MKRPLRILCALVVIGALCGFALVLFRGGSVAVLPLPNPNGYDDLVKAGEILDGDLPGWQELRDMNEEQLRQVFSTTVLAKHQEALALAGVGLSRPCRVRLEYSPTSVEPLNEISAVRRVAFAFIATGRLAEMENRMGDAAKSYLDAIRVSHEASRGGSLVNSMSALTIEAVGLAYLRELAGRLDAKQREEVVDELESIDGKRETIETVLQQERTWARRAYGLKGQIIRLLSLRTLWRGERNHADRMRKNQTRIRLLTVELALRSCQSAQGRIPQGLHELVPKTFQRVPIDPFSGQPLVYRAQGTNWVLYSIGPDRVDDGGTPVGPRQRGSAERKGDWFFDSPW